MTTTASGPSGATALQQTVARLLQEAITALSAGQPDAAERVLGRALELAPANAEAHRLMGIAALMRGAHAEAVAHLRRALTHRPDDATINMTLGSALVETGASADGLAHLQRACELDPENAEAWYNFGIVLQFTRNLEQARDAFEHAVAIVPGHIQARNKLADAMFNLGDTPAAARMLRGTLSRQPDSAEAWIALGNLKTEPLRSEDIQQLQNLLSRPGVPHEARVALAFTLAKALEDQADYAAAFDIVRRANALKRRHVYWNREEERARVDAIAGAFSGPQPKPADAALGREVIFVVHLPRSGSTLTEQILASHPQVHGGDELDVLPAILDEESDRQGRPFPQWAPTATSEDWQRLGKTYLDRTHYLREQHPRFTDKTPNNWAFVGAALTMLPGARVVNSRRDPLETCFACYRQLFPIGCDFTYDLDDLVDYYDGYDRLSALWRKKFPQRYFDHSYELLQSDTDNQIRRLLEFCQLPFDSACLDFHQTRRTVYTLSSAQVRQPLQHDTARSARYGVTLGPLRDKLRTTMGYEG